MGFWCLLAFSAFLVSCSGVVYGPASPGRTKDFNYSATYKSGYTSHNETDPTTGYYSGTAVVLLGAATVPGETGAMGVDLFGEFQFGDKNSAFAVRFGYVANIGEELAGKGWTLGPMYYWPLTETIAVDIGAQILFGGSVTRTTGTHKASADMKGVRPILGLRWHVQALGRLFLTVMLEASYLATTPVTIENEDIFFQGGSLVGGLAFGF
ncbi:hypothetical protein KKC22_02365 [Myxococcota bacterium]|nr:hypothetical protein [Myxococcota bacterium]